MTLMCIDRSQSPTHKGSILQGRKSFVNNNNNINQQNANHTRRNSCSPPLSKNACNNQQSQESSSKHLSNAKLERSISEPATERKIVQSTNSSRYKTELCRPFEENGTCKYGDKCQFAHGEKELRSMARHPKYKTELCRTFHSTGLCPYGPRCHFIHNSEQTKKSLLTNLACNSTPIPPVSRPKALTSLGSAGDLSPTSSHGGSPTGSKSFEDMFNQGPLSPALNNVFFTQELSNMYQSLFEPSREYSPEIFDSVNVYNEKLMSLADNNIDNYNCQGSPVLDLYSTAPLTPSTPNDSNYSNFLRFSVFDSFPKQ